MDVKFTNERDRFSTPPRIAPLFTPGRPPMRLLLPESPFEQSVSASSGPSADAPKRTGMVG